MKVFLFGLNAIILAVAVNYAAAESNGINEYAHSIKGKLTGRAYGQAVAACARHHGRTRINFCGAASDVTPPGDSDITPPADPDVTPPEGIDITPPADPGVTPPGGDSIIPPGYPNITPPADPGVIPPDDGLITTFNTASVSGYTSSTLGSVQSYNLQTRKSARQSALQAKELAATVRRQSREAASQAKAIRDMARANARVAAGKGKGSH